MPRFCSPCDLEKALEDDPAVSYLHAKPTPEESTNIRKMTGDVFGVSSDGGQTWNACLDASGNAVMNILSVIGIDASWINADNLTAVSANLGGWGYVSYRTRNERLHILLEVRVIWTGLQYIPRQ